ncbi:hypothetical protein ACJIZ3_008176 [Penstemon smallii]|uniref:Uncharacterized protein n=1 Tax=Penstemon smallii TaxID=265156 RepID=A0ABD3TA71_9LAMI
MMMMRLGRLMKLKSKFKSMKVKKKLYDKIEKSESMRVEIRSKQARKLIACGYTQNCRFSKEQNLCFLITIVQYKIFLLFLFFLLYWIIDFIHMPCLICFNSLKICLPAAIKLQ